MKVSLVWLGLITIGIVLILVGYKGVEAFANMNVKEGFQSGASSDLQISTCPADSKSFIDMNGRTVCCQGSVENGKCIGNLICTLSEAGKDLPTCNTWYAALLDERGRDRCPASLPTYFEGGKLGRGCTVGKRNKDGTGPDISSAKFCKLYTLEKDELLKEDSCTNQKMLDEAKCPVPNAKKRLTRWRNDIPLQVYCDFVNPSNGLPISCGEDMTTYAQHDYAKKQGIISQNWEETYASSNKINWCRIQKMVEMDKTVSFEDLKYVPINPNSGLSSPIGPVNIPKPQPQPQPQPPPQPQPQPKPQPQPQPPPQPKPQPPPPPAKCAFNARAYADMYDDLKKAFGYNEAQLKQHYLDYGLGEGRSPCGKIRPDCKFTSEQYYRLHPDVQKAGMDAAQHYRQYGMNEDRQVC
jgi:hypothetical protein